MSADVLDFASWARVLRAETQQVEYEATNADYISVALTIVRRAKFEDTVSAYDRAVVELDDIYDRACADPAIWDLGNEMRARLDDLMAQGPDERAKRSQHLLSMLRASADRECS